MDKLIINLNQILTRIRNAEKQFGRPAHCVSLLAASKSQPLSAIETLAQANQLAFGENYLQEACPKIKACVLPLVWHFIGALQSKKIAQLAQHFSWIHTLCRFSDAQKLCQHTSKRINVCIEVKLDNNPNKPGIFPKDVPHLVEALLPLSPLHLHGLMVMPPYTTDFNSQRHYFRLIKQLFDQLNQQGAKLDTLSMGTTHDLEAAISEGATLVRIGQGLFGKR